MRSNRKKGWCIALCWVVAATLGLSPSAFGNGGVLFAKPFPWSTKSQISDAYEFRILEDHTGYYTLNPGPRQRQVQVGNVVEVVYDDELTTPKTVRSEAELKPLQDIAARLQALGEASPIAQKALAGRLAAVETEIGYFQHGNFKIDGQWISAAEAAKRNELEKNLQQQALVEAESNELVRALEQHDLTPERYAQTIDRLKTLHVGHETQASQLRAQFEKDRAAVSGFRVDAQKFLQTAAKDPAMTGLADAKGFSDLRTLPPELATTAGNLQEKLGTLERDTYYRTWRNQLRPEADALFAIIHLSTAIGELKAGTLRTAATEATELNPERLPNLGHDYPPLNTAVKNSCDLIQSTLLEFTQHCTRALALEELGKSAEAIEEYNKAAALSQEPGVLKKIADLRERSLGL